MMATRWRPGVWLGKSWMSDEHIVGTEHGTVLESRSVKADSGDVDLETLLKITGRVHSPFTSWTQGGERGGGQTETMPHVGEPSEDAQRTPISVPLGGPEPSAGRSRRPSEMSLGNSALLRQWKITKPLIDAFGYTPGCGKCEALQGRSPEVEHHGHKHTE